MILLWLAAWLVTLPNLYGWLTDDAMTFTRIQLFESGGSHVFDIQWFHAYMWFLMFLPWKLHWAIPSYIIARAWTHADQFRALVIYTIVLHAILLGIIAAWMRMLCKNSIVCFGALLLLMTSPTYLLYSGLLDSRYLGLLAGIPALMLLQANQRRLGSQLTWSDSLVGVFLPGFLIGVGQAIHYTELYLCGPFALIYWLAGIWNNRNPRALLRLAVFVAGILAWFVPVQLLSLHYHGFGDSMIGTLIFQVDNHISPYSHQVNLETWYHIILDDMGAPLVLAVLVGVAIVAVRRWRPVYVGSSGALMMLGTCAISCSYFAATPAFPFFRQLSGLQIFFTLFAMVALERLWAVARARSAIIATGTVAAAYLGIAYLPSFVHGPEVFVAHQGLGRAVNLAHSVATSDDRVFFVATYDWDPDYHAIISRRDFEQLRDSDVIVTDYPIFYHVKYPDLFAAMYETKPLGSFPTEWCTQETWSELRSYFWFRRWYDEPYNCEAQVFRVGDVRRQLDGVPLRVSAVRADSSLTAAQGPLRAFAKRNPQLPLDDNYYGRGIYADQWVSKPSDEPHWLEVDFEASPTIGAVTIVPPDYIVPPEFLYDGRVRLANVDVLGDAGDGWRTLWSGRSLQDKAIFTARFTPTSIRRIRLVVRQPGPPANHSAAMLYVHFPGYRLVFPQRGSGAVASGV